MADLIVYRLADWDTPVRVQPHRNAGRFNRAGRALAQYASLHPLGPWAEYMRANGIRTLDALLRVQARTWALRLPQDHIVELTYGNAPEFDLDPFALVSDDWGPCQDFADHCRQEPHLPERFITPSAALPGTRNLVVLGPRVAIPYDTDPIGEVDVPASLTADKGRPIHTLLREVRHFGDPHAEFEAWRVGNPFRFEKPEWPLLDVAP